MQSVSLTNTQIKKYKEELKNKTDLTEKEKLVLNSKSGWITVKKISDNTGYIEPNEAISGFTYCFGEGVALFLENPKEWFHTSTIQSIDKNNFKTINSVYSYKFQEVKKSMIKVPCITCNTPFYATDGSAGADLKAVLDNILSSTYLFNCFLEKSGINIKIVMHPGGRCLIPTGLCIGLPEGYEAQVRPRSGLALKKGVTILNTPGTIDSDYRGEIGVILINLSNEDVVIENGERIAQLIITKYEQAEFISVDDLDDTDRGTGGFGHTGK